MIPNIISSLSNKNMRPKEYDNFDFLTLSSKLKQKIKKGMLFLTTFPHEECIEIKARSRTYKSTALSSGSVDVKLRPKSIRT